MKYIFEVKSMITKEEKTKPKKVNFFADFQNCAKAGNQKHERQVHPLAGGDRLYRRPGPGLNRL